MNQTEQFEIQLNQHKDAVYRQMIRVCGNHDDAEDVLVEAILNAYKHYEALESPEKFQAWLSVIGRRVCGRIRKKESLLPVIALGESIAESFITPEPFDSGDEFVSKVHSVLELIPEQERVVFEMRDIKGLSGQETADELNISLAAQKSRLHRARAKVRELLDDCVNCA